MAYKDAIEAFAAIKTVVDNADNDKERGKGSDEATDVDLHAYDAIRQIIADTEA